MIFLIVPMIKMMVWMCVFSVKATFWMMKGLWFVAVFTLKVSALGVAAIIGLIGAITAQKRQRAVDAAPIVRPALHGGDRPDA